MMTNVVENELNLTDDECPNLDEIEFRARFRERIYLTLETQVFSAANGNKILEETELEVAYKKETL